MKLEQILDKECETKIGKVLDFLYEKLADDTIPFEEADKLSEDVVVITRLTNDFWQKLQTDRDDAKEQLLILLSCDDGTDTGIQNDIRDLRTELKSYEKMLLNKKAIQLEALDVFNLRLKEFEIKD